MNEPERKRAWQWYCDHPSIHRDNKGPRNSKRCQIHIGDYGATFHRLSWAGKVEARSTGKKKPTGKKNF